MEIEQAGTVHLAKYAKKHALNPIYFQNSFIYLGGGLYRRILGYDVLWDKEAEAKLQKALDFYLTRVDTDGSYYFEKLEVTADFKLFGIRWHREVCPQAFKFDLQWPFEMKTGEKLLARVNLLDKPNHVDIEREDGTVFSIQLLTYLNQLSKHFKRKGPARETKSKKTTGISLQRTKRKGLSLVRRPLEENPLRKVSG